MYLYLYLKHRKRCICICIYIWYNVYDPSPGRNSISCSQCMLLLHKTWSGINTWLFEDPTGLRCKGESEPINGRTVTEVDVDGTMPDVEATIGYLDDMLCFGGGCGSAIAATFCVAWEKFRNLLPVLTTRHLSPRICRKVYQASVRSAMLHGNETWGPKEPKLRCLQCNGRVMTHWICGIKDRDKTPSASLLLKLGIEDVTLVFCCRWNISQNFHFPAKERKEVLVTHCLNVWRRMSIGVA